MRIIRLLVVCMALLMITSLFPGCTEDKPSDGTPSESSRAADIQETDMIKDTGKYYVLSNEKVEVIIEKESGYVETVSNKKTGTVNKNPDLGRWPFYIEYSPNGSLIYESSIARECNNTVALANIYQENGRDFLELTYDNLIIDGAEKLETGIRATVVYSLGRDSDYFKFNVTLDMEKSEGQVRALHLANGGDLRSGDGSSEYLIAPAWGRGTKWKNPIYNNYFLSGRTLGYPGSGDQSLECGWLDLSGSDQGIGIAYIDKEQIVTEFRIESSGSGMCFDIVLFEPKQVLGESVPLKSGEKFMTGDVLVAAHEGTWHSLADDYRTEFNSAFTNTDGTPDYLIAQTISQRALDIRYFLREIGAINQVQHSTAAEMWDAVCQDMEETGASYEKSMYWQVGINENTYGSDTPLLMPFNEKLADDGETFKDTYEKYFGSGKDSYQGRGGILLQYCHPFAMAVNREELTSLFPTINPYQHKESWDGCDHWSVCIDNDTVTNFWKETVIPMLKEGLADAVQFDQGSLVQTICDMEGHYHGLSAVERLSSHIKAINELARMTRKEIGNDAFIMSEASNDLTCRYIDVRQNHWATFAPLWEGEFEYGTMLYTHPQYVYLNANYVSDSLGNTQEFYLQSTVLGGPVLLSDGPNHDVKKEMVRFADALRARGDEIGYPHGYRDTLGMKTSTYSLFARVYVKDHSVTVVYCSNAGISNATIDVDLEKLGFEGKGVHTFKIENMDAYTGAFQTFVVE